MPRTRTPAAGGVRNECARMGTYVLDRSPTRTSEGNTRLRGVAKITASWRERAGCGRLNYRWLSPRDRESPGRVDHSLRQARSIADGVSPLRSHKDHGPLTEDNVAVARRCEPQQSTVGISEPSEDDALAVDPQPPRQLVPGTVDLLLRREDPVAHEYSFERRKLTAGSRATTGAHHDRIAESSEERCVGLASDALANEHSVDARAGIDGTGRRSERRSARRNCQRDRTQDNADSERGASSRGHIYYERVRPGAHDDYNSPKLSTSCGASPWRSGENLASRCTSLGLPVVEVRSTGCDSDECEVHFGTVGSRNDPHESVPRKPREESCRGAMP